MFLLMPSLMAEDRIEALQHEADADRLAALARMPAATPVSLWERVRRATRRIRVIARGAAAA
jgi:hypothetical protein